MSDYQLTVGLEIHAELKTHTKMFCESQNDPHAPEANTHVCPVCMAFPGTLPVINKAAVRHVLRVGAAVEGTLADYTEFDRKNYFYPDLPKGYQISQYKHPLVSGGALKGVALTRIHLEEDTARSQHTEGDYSLIDFNRAGVPLMELVTEPVIHDAKTALLFAQELQLLLRTLGVSDANMEKGEMRVEANISVSRDKNFGTKVEVKNLNSFKAVEKAIEFEAVRQRELLEKGGKVVQETRGWNENTQRTFSQRVKEDSQEYRYFPDPDLPKLYISRIPEFALETLASSLPELPWEKRERYHALGIKAEDAEILVRDDLYAAIYAHELEPLTDQKVIRAGAHLLLSDIRGKTPTAEELECLKGTLATSAEMYVEGTLSSTATKQVLMEILEFGGDPKEIAEKRGLLQVHDSDILREHVHTVLSAHPSVVNDYKEGKEAALKFLVGQGMKLSKGSANPQQLATVIKEEIGK